MQLVGEACVPAVLVRIIEIEHVIHGDMHIADSVPSGSKRIPPGGTLPLISVVVVRHWTCVGLRRLPG